ncbi:hypothetical protein PFISCL1PPCAC_11419 [Pristionchus fissidentatus]|uniref:C2H2-type domain-containing protein n=1 Tax=Pristionchus fissidentatus TaxID=1538716 RepID=A0AAV5VK61_9BILA|nr:hypothetical protein PFISCL1PPCAC_11419 [Pristionchus fissidentatus]
MTRRGVLSAEEATEAVEDVIMNPSPQLSSRSNHINRIPRKIAIMGYPCVGKSSITLRFINGNFPEAYDTTIEDRHDKPYSWKGREYALRITDTAGQQEFTIFPRSCSIDVDGFILVYAIDDRKSFEIIQTIHDKIVECVGDMNVPIVVVGNKLDLQYQGRVVTREEGETLAKKWKANFVEISARDLDKPSTSSDAIHSPFAKTPFRCPESRCAASFHFKDELEDHFLKGDHSSNSAKVARRSQSLHIYWSGIEEPAANSKKQLIREAAVNSIFEKAILAIEVAKGNMTPEGRVISGPGSKSNSSKCSLM